MASELTITVNGKLHRVEATPDTPLLYVLRNELGLNGPQFGCGSESCGACTVLLGAKAVKSCKLPVSEATVGAITTLEGLSVDGDTSTPLSAWLHPVQRAFIEEQAAQCGYCSNGMIMATAALLAKYPHPTDEQIREALDDNLCRCGAHLRILRAVKRAAELFDKERNPDGK
jgi:nicotinate dehydrogenase subunit A